MWDRTTGEPVHNAIVWQDTRTDEPGRRVLGATAARTASARRPACRSRPTSPGRRSAGSSTTSTARASAPRRATCCSATWTPGCIWNLTGGTDGGLHVTDVTNASRTHADGPRDARLGRRAAATRSACRARCCRRSGRRSEVYGEVRSGGALAGRADRRRPRRPAGGARSARPASRRARPRTPTAPATSCCSTPAPRRCSRRTACSPRSATRSATQDAVYCLEGSIAITGALVQWLRDNLRLIKAAPEVEELAQTVDDNGGVYFVPAFSGLFAPYWKSTRAA